MTGRVRTSMRRSPEAARIEVCDRGQHGARNVRLGLRPVHLVTLDRERNESEHEVLHVPRAYIKDPRDVSEALTVSAHVCHYLRQQAGGLRVQVGSRGGSRPSRAAWRACRKSSPR
jgi:hypothetical protein